MESKKVIVLGSSHYNTIGMVQSLGRGGCYVIGVLINGGGIVKNSIYIKEIYSVNTYQEGIDYIADNLVQENPTVIIPCGDEAALLLEKNKEKLYEHFYFQRIAHVSLSEAMDKYFQAKVAQEVGFDVPKSFQIDKNVQSHDEIVFPCIIKPLMSCYGLKNDIRVAYSVDELVKMRDEIFANTNKVIVQEFIENCDNELNIIGCAMDDGHCVIPCCIKKIRIHPKSRGSVSVALVGPIENEHQEICRSIEKFINKIGYIGLFSVELMKVSSKNKTYFIEANLRNDALNPFIEKEGVNLPLLHVQNLLGEKLIDYKPVNKKMKMICEPIHSASLYHNSINVFQWLYDIITSNGFMLYYKEDKKLFWSQYYDKIGRLF